MGFVWGEGKKRVSQNRYKKPNKLILVEKLGAFSGIWGTDVTKHVRLRVLATKKKYFSSCFFSSSFSSKV